MNFDLEMFVENFFASRGAIIEKSGSNMDVLAPRNLARRIGIPNFCSLKIGNENSNDYAIHYGSKLIESITEAACETVPLTIAQLSFHYLKSGGFDRLVQDLFGFDNAVVRVENSAEVKTEYTILTCRYLAQSDEQKEGVIPLGFNLETGAPVDNIESMLDSVEKKYEVEGLDAGLGEEKIRKIIKWMQNRALKLIKIRIEPFVESMNRRFKRDVANLNEYYVELKKEMTKALKRPGLSSDLMAEREKKINLIPDELTKKKEDLFKKYSIKVNLRLSGVMLIRTPAVKLFCRADIGRRQKHFTLFFNPVTKSIDPLLCAKCGEETFQVHFNKLLHPCCIQCG
jgi:hypothetical protein